MSDKESSWKSYKTIDHQSNEWIISIILVIKLIYKRYTYKTYLSNNNNSIFYNSLIYNTDKWLNNKTFKKL